MDFFKSAKQFSMVLLNYINEIHIYASLLQNKTQHFCREMGEDVKQRLDRDIPLTGYTAHVLYINYVYTETTLKKDFPRNPKNNARLKHN